MPLAGYVTVREAADVIGCPRPRVYRYIKEGHLSAQRKGPMLFLPLEEVEQFRNRKFPKREDTTELEEPFGQ